MVEEIKSVLEKHKEHIPVFALAELLAVIDEAEADIMAKAEHTYENCHNLTCRRKCQKDDYNMAIDEFAEKMLELAPRNYAGELSLGGRSNYLSANLIKKIAEQIKGE